MPRGKGDAFEEIRLGGSAVTAICHRYHGSFAQFRSKGYAGRMKHLCRNGNRSSHHVVLMIAPVHRLRIVLAGKLVASLTCVLTVYLHICTEYLIRCHTDS